MTEREHVAARDRYDVEKFTDAEIATELGNDPPRQRSEAYLAALRVERDRRSAARSRDDFNQGGHMTYRLWVNEYRTILFRMWENGTVECAARPDPDAVWGPPVVLEEETVVQAPASS